MARPLLYRANETMAADNGGVVLELFDYGNVVGVSVGPINGGTLTFCLTPEIADLLASRIREIRGRDGS